MGSTQQSDSEDLRPTRRDQKSPGSEQSPGNRTPWQGAAPKFPDGTPYLRPAEVLAKKTSAGFPLCNVWPKIIPRSIRGQNQDAGIAASAFLFRDILQGFRLRLDLHRSGTSGIHRLLPGAMRPSDLYKLDRLESAAPSKIRRHC